MPVQENGSVNQGIGDTVELEETTGRTRTVIHVVMDGVHHEMETLDSFAIKFSLLTNMPVTRVKHLMRKLPASLWT
ncbi:MAG TPA: hypothetical protein VLA34_12975, partial [Candidatus Krumholzibacterium sp.]|nr:hypothetical protein [Candidatus Krumholzibacterium sp.]